MKAATLRLDPRGLCASTEPALVGVSGGRDSVALLTELHQRGWRALTVCHFDHGWREESAAEAGFVASLAARLGYPLVVEKNGADLARTETAGRRARLAFFARTADQLQIPRLFLAHHADDQVETVLWNLLRGTGRAGLGGIAPKTSHQIEGVRLQFQRPLLGTWRWEIDAYVQERGLSFREDASNADPRHTRNRLRHQVLPEIERLLGREVKEAIWRSGEILAAEEEWLASATPRLGGTELGVAEVRALPVAMQRRVVHAWLSGQGVPQVDFASVEAVRGLLQSPGPAKVNLSAGWHARRQMGRLWLEAAP